MISTGILLGVLAMPASGEVSMSSQIVTGEILDSRVTGCGVEIVDGRIATLRPFIEASNDVTGKFRINITKRSRSGTSMTSQSNAFSGGTLGGSVVVVDRPSTVSVDLEVQDASGVPLCRLRRQIELNEETIEL